MDEVFLSPGVRTPFAKAGGVFAHRSPIELSIPVLKAMNSRARPDLIAWGQVIPEPTVSNIAREAVYEAGLDPSIPAYSTVMACSSSFLAAIQVAGMLGSGGNHLTMVGGAESMSHAPLALKYKVAEGLLEKFAKDPLAAAEAMGHITTEDFDLPTKGWANRQSGKSMGVHMEETAKEFHIPRADQDERAFRSHQGAVRGQDSGFFNDLIVPLDGVERDNLPRRDTTLEKLARLPPAFDRTSGMGSLTAGNSSPLTDGAAALWVADSEGIRRLGQEPVVRLADWEIGALDLRTEGLLMAPARAIPRLLARNKLKANDIALWEIHEAFAAQVLANVQALMDPVYRREKARVDADLGTFSWDRVNPNGGSIALGHPFAATGARILSQAVKELTAMPPGSKAVVSVCADGGEGTAALLERIT